jgi:hypothetical protein
MSDIGAIATRYIELVGAHDLDPLEELFADSLVATTVSATFDKAGWIAALRRLLPILARNEVRQVVVDGSVACIVYDFLTDTEAGAVPCAEWITVDADGRITGISLLFEKTNWAQVAAAIQERS